MGHDAIPSTLVAIPYLRQQEFQRIDLLDQENKVTNSLALEGLADQPVKLQVPTESRIRQTRQAAERGLSRVL